MRSLSGLGLVTLVACSSGTSDDAAPIASHCAPAGDGGAETVYGPFGSASNDVNAFTADDAAVYVALIDDDESSQGTTATSTIVRAPLDCGAASTLWTQTTDTLGATQLTVVGGRLYFVLSDGIHSIATTGGTAALEASMSQSAASPAQFVVFGGAIDWLDHDGALWTLATGGGRTPRQLGQAPGTSSGVVHVDPVWTSLATDGANVYVTQVPNAAEPASDDGGALEVSATGSVVAIPVGGGTPTTLAADRPAPGNIVVSGSTLYWTEISRVVPGVDTNGNSGPIVKLALPSGTPTVVVPDEMLPSQITMIGTTLYWTDGNGGGDDFATLRELPSGGTPTTLPASPGPLGAQGIWIAGTGAYWIPGAGASTLYGLPLARQ